MTIQEKISEKFGKDDIKVSFANEQFNLQQTGVDFYSSKLPKKDFNWYLYEDSMGLESIRAFNKNHKQSFAWLIALSYSHGELGSEFPSHLICISGARSSKERNGDGTFNGIIYTLSENQNKEIMKEYEELSDNSYEEAVQDESDKIALLTSTGNGSWV